MVNARLQRAFRRMREWYHPKVITLIERYYSTGDFSLAAAIKKYDYALIDIMDNFDVSPLDYDEYDMRTVRLFVAIGATVDLVHKFHSWNEKPDQDLWGYFIRMLRKCGWKDKSVLPLLAEVINYEESHGINSAGRYALSLSESDLKKLLGYADTASILEGRVAFLLRRAPERVDAEIVEKLMRKNREERMRLCVPEELLEVCGGVHRYLFYRLSKKLTLWQQWEALRMLAKTDSARFAQEYFEASRAMLRDASEPNDFPERVAECFVGTFGLTAEAEIRRLIEYRLPVVLENCASIAGQEKYVPSRDIFHTCVEAMGEKSEKILRAGLAVPFPHVRILALRQFIGFDNAAFNDLIFQEFDKLLKENDIRAVQPALKMALEWNAARIEPLVWNMMFHKNKSVRDLAAATLARSGEVALEKALPLLEHKRADVRLAAVQLVARTKSQKAPAVLAQCLDGEENDDVRDVLYMALAPMVKAAGKAVTLAEMRHRIERVSGRIMFPLSKWVKLDALPPLYLLNRKVLDKKALAYLIYRQARWKNTEPDIEAAPLYRLIDHSRSGDFALALWHGFLKAGASSQDRWALTMIGIFGDDRTVPLIVAEIPKWADDGRGKLCEYATEALALIGSDAALQAVSAIGMRFRSKYKNIGKAARDAFAAAAVAKGITQEELGDRVVPWFGLEADKPKVFASGGKCVEVRIDEDFKLELVNAAERKPIKSLPKSMSSETKKEFKELTLQVRDVSRLQTWRLENLMVRQYRMPFQRWKELYLVHPLLRPFTVRLVWGGYSKTGKLLCTFRSDGQRLINLAGAAMRLPKVSAIGIIHPLEIASELRSQWAEHLVSARIDQPFPQMMRPVTYLRDTDRDRRTYEDVKGVDLNGMTFKSRAEKLGWLRGSVCDAGWIPFYYKTFAQAGVDFILYIDNISLAIDVYDEVTLQEGRFVKAGSVKVGRYVYDEPSDENDPRVMPFGKIPPIVFSEIVGDLEKIARNADAEQ